MEILGVWMWPQSVRLQGADAAVSRCARMGVTDIFFLTKGLAGTTSHLSRIAPPCCDHDLLAQLLAAAHAKGIRVHAWLTSASDGHYKRLHPQSGRCHYTRGRDNDLISLTDEGYLSYMESVVRELCDGWAIDGLHLDYIRYNHLLYGWSEEDVSRYAAAGADPACLRELMDKTFTVPDKDPEYIFNALRAGNKSAAALAQARRKDVVRFAKRLTAAARSVRGNLILSAALMPEGAYDDTAFADLHYGQNYRDAAGLYDFVLPMAYSKAYEKDSAWVRSVSEGTMRRGLKTIAGLHAYEGGTGITLSQDIASLSGSGVCGVCLFREGAFAAAFCDAQELTLYNALDKPITRLIASRSGDVYPLDVHILPGEEQRFPLPFFADTIRAFTPEAEICVYLSR